MRWLGSRPSLRHQPRRPPPPIALRPPLKARAAALGEEQEAAGEEAAGEEEAGEETGEAEEEAAPVGLDEEEGDAEWLRIEIGLIELAAEEYGRLSHRTPVPYRSPAGPNGDLH